MSWLEADLEQVHTRLATVERAIADLLATLPETTIISAVTGVGPRVAAAALGYLPPETGAMPTLRRPMPGSIHVKCSPAGAAAVI